MVITNEETKNSLNQNISTDHINNNQNVITQRQPQRNNTCNYQIDMEDPLYMNPNDNLWFAIVSLSLYNSNFHCW